MKFKLKDFEVNAGRPIVFLQHDVAKSYSINVGDRLKVSFSGKSIISRVDILDNYLKKDELALSNEVIEYLECKYGSEIDISFVSMPKSHQFIAKKMNGKGLTRQEIFTIIQDIVDNALTEVETAQFVLAVYKNGMNHNETFWLTESMYKTGSVLSWKSKDIADKHCIGGIAGNRTTPIVVSICASAGIIMPKTSSRAITSAAGTADVIEVLSKVDFPSSKLKKIVNETGACLAWGGSLGLAPADDKLIKIERILNLDPEAQLLASILSKKLAVGSKYVLIDIPYGENAKVSKSEGEKLKNKFLELGKHFKLKMKVILTLGNQPIGNGIGPVLEMMDVLKVLKRDNPPVDLERKAISISGMLIEMLGKAKKGMGEQLAREILDSGEALKKFNQIIDAQGRVKVTLKPAKYSHTIRTEKKGFVKSINNKTINYIANTLGCPLDKRSGLYLYKHNKDEVMKGENLVTLYAESEQKLKDGIETFYKKNPILIE